MSLARPDTIHVQSQKMARGLKFRIYEVYVEGLYFPGSENKGADQLRGYCKADLRLCFRICKKPVFSQGGSYSIISLVSISEILDTSYCLKLCSHFCAQASQKRKGFLLTKLKACLSIECKLNPKFSDKLVLANSADPDQTAPRGAV